jgi:hypothetical protein
MWVFGVVVLAIFILLVVTLPRPPDGPTDRWPY